MAQNTVRSISERCLRMINFGDVPRDSRFERRDIEYMVRDSLGKQILASWFASRNAKEGMDVDDGFITVVTRSVGIGPNGENYIDLDFDWVVIPDGSGIQSVRASVDPTINPLSTTQLQNRSAFIPVPARFNDIYRGLPAQSLEAQIGWALRGKRIWFTDLAGQRLTDLGIGSVDIDVVSTSDIVLDAEKPLPIPPNVSIAIVSEVVAFFLPLISAPKDMLNDGNPNIKPLR